MKKTILDNRRITIREVADDVDISFDSCQAIFTDVSGMKRAAAKIVLKLLNFKQKQRRMKKFFSYFVLISNLILEDTTF